MPHKHGTGEHTHGAAPLLDDRAADILRRGLGELLRMTEGLKFRAFPSEKYPLPLANAVYAPLPDADSIRREVFEGLNDDPIGVLESALALVELYESNQPDAAGCALEDMPFIRACFASKRCNGWISILGGADRGALEAAVNARWQFKFFSGPARPTGVYYILNMLARYGFVYGRVAFGDMHSMGHFVEEHCPGLLVCAGKLGDLELTLALAAMKMGVPAIVPSDWPFPFGKIIKADSPGDIAEAVVAFPNIRRLLSMPSLPQMPDYCSQDNAGQAFEAAAVWGDTPESFYIVRKGRPGKTPVSVAGSPEGPMGVIVTIDSKPLDAFDRKSIEETIAESLSLMKGVKADYDGQRLRVSLAAGVDLDPTRIGEVLVAAAAHEFPRLAKVSAEIILGREALRKTAPLIEREKKLRETEIKAATEETVKEFIACVGCSPFAPDHVCIVTPERPPQCGRAYEFLKTGALYGYDDMTNIHHSALHRDLNSFGIVAKGMCIDPARGEWQGVNDRVTQLTKGRTRRIQLHCLDECPTTGCGCFNFIMFKTALPRPGVGIMEAGYKGRSPDGHSWKDLHYALAGKQTPGMAGASAGYLSSRQFLRAHGGWKSVVWVSPRIAAEMGDKLPRGIEVGTEA